MGTQPFVSYRNMRPKFVETFLNNLVNWDFAAKNFDQEIIVDSLI